MSSPEVKSNSMEKISWIIMTIVMAFIFGVLVANCVYFAKLINDHKTDDVNATSNNMKALLWFNAIFSGIVGIGFLYCIFMAVRASKEDIKKISASANAGYQEAKRYYYPPTQGQMSGTTNPTPSGTGNITSSGAAITPQTGNGMYGEQ